MGTNSAIKLYGNPPFALSYIHKGEVIFVDLQLIRPCIEEYLDKEEVYKSTLYFEKKLLKKIKVLGKTFIVVNCD
jgi:hypothetical protein